jgi:hypothetical protein
MRYLFLTYYTKPDGKIDESMMVANKIRRKDWQMVNVIMDFKDCQVLKASVGNAVATKDWEHVVSTYYQHYPHIFERLFEENGHAAPAVVQEEPKVSAD